MITGAPEKQNLEQRADAEEQVMCHGCMKYVPKGTEFKSPEKVPYCAKDCYDFHITFEF